MANSAPAAAGTYLSTLYNCLVIGNYTPGNGGGIYASTAYNCTIVGNSAGANGGGVYLGEGPCSLINCIVYFNTATTSGSNWQGVVVFTNTCTAPAAAGVTVTDDPMFVDKGSGSGSGLVLGNYHLKAS